MEKIKNFKILSLMIGICLILISLSFVGAVGDTNTCLNPNNIIIRLYQSTNSHIAVWNDAHIGDEAYNYQICYSGTAPANPHGCKAENTNAILWLNNTYNTHASTTQSADYNIPVCYGNLVCSAKTTCASDEQIVVRLAQNSNSHISNSSDTNYPVKICCKQGGEAPYWANMKEEKINSAQIGDSVLMVYEQEGINTAYPFDVLESDSGEIYFGNDNVKLGISSFIKPNKIIAKYIITQADYETGSCVLGFCETDNKAEFYFRVNGINSNILNVAENSDKIIGANSPPTIIITSPAIDSNFTVDTSINMNTSIFDEDDDLQVQWTYGDGSNSEWLMNCLTNTTCNTIKSYNRNGAKVIKAVAKEMTRTQSAQDYTRIYVYQGVSATNPNGINVFAIIDSPKFGITENTRIVNVNGQSSFVAKCETFTCPDGQTTTCYDVESLKCYRKAESSVLDFLWNFDDSTTDTSKTPFTKFFPTPGEHTINLEVTYTE